MAEKGLPLFVCRAVVLITGAKGAAAGQEGMVGL
jgi:hypothetical protein